MEIEINILGISFFRHIFSTDFFSFILNCYKYCLNYLFKIDFLLLNILDIE